MAIRAGLDVFEGDAVAIVMADASDDPEDLVRYHRLLEDGWDCAFGSRFVPGAEVYDYPRLKLTINRLANWFIRILFRHRYNDTTNAFKAYRREVIETIQPLLSKHFNLTVEMPLKAIVRGHTYEVIPTSWTNRTSGEPKLAMREMGSRYLFIVLYVWLENALSRGDYQVRTSPSAARRPAGRAALVLAADHQELLAEQLPGERDSGSSGSGRGRAAGFRGTSRGDSEGSPFRARTRPRRGAPRPPDGSAPRSGRRNPSTGRSSTGSSAPGSRSGRPSPSPRASFPGRRRSPPGRRGARGSWRRRCRRSGRGELGLHDLGRDHGRVGLVQGLLVADCVDRPGLLRGNRADELAAAGGRIEDLLRAPHQLVHMGPDLLPDSDPRVLVDVAEPVGVEALEVHSVGFSLRLGVGTERWLYPRT